jgi:hypothetical protein
MGRDRLVARAQRTRAATGERHGALSVGFCEGEIGLYLGQLGTQYGGIQLHQHVARRNLFALGEAEPLNASGDFGRHDHRLVWLQRADRPNILDHRIDRDALRLDGNGTFGGWGRGIGDPPGRRALLRQVMIGAAPERQRGDSQSYPERSSAH